MELYLSSREQLLHRLRSNRRYILGCKKKYGTARSQVHYAQLIYQYKLAKQILFPREPWYTPGYLLLSAALNHQVDEWRIGNLSEEDARAANIVLADCGRLIRNEKA